MARMKNKTRQTASVMAHKAAPKPVGNSLLVAITLVLCIAAAFIAATFIRNAIFKNHITIWADVAKRSPKKRRAHENYGQALSSAGMYSEALKELKTVMALPDDGSVPLRDLYRELGVVYFRIEKYDDAISAWQTGLRFAPYDPSLLNNLSIVMMQTQRFEEAAAAAQTALASDPYMPQALNTMGQVFLIKKDYNKAVEYFLKAIDREPDVPARYWNVALAAEQAHKLDMALQYANKYVSMEPDPVGRQRALGYIQYLKGIMRR